MFKIASYVFTFYSNIQSLHQNAKDKCFEDLNRVVRKKVFKPNQFVSSALQNCLFTEFMGYFCNMFLKTARRVCQNVDDTTSLCLRQYVSPTKHMAIIQMQAFSNWRIDIKRNFVAMQQYTKSIFKWLAYFNILEITSC